MRKMSSEIDTPCLDIIDFLEDDEDAPGMMEELITRLNERNAVIGSATYNKDPRPQAAAAAGVFFSCSKDLIMQNILHAMLNYDNERLVRMANMIHALLIKAKKGDGSGQ